MDIVAYLEQYRPAFKKASEDALPRKMTEGWLKQLHEPKYGTQADTHALTEAISKPCYDLLDRGGKMWRPALLLMAACAVSGKDEKEMLPKILPFVPVVELIHNGSLIIDDMEDKSELRRGKPAIHKLYGEDIAINAGNALYFLAYQPLLGYPASVRARLYDVVTTGTMKLHLGQAMDIYWHNHPGRISKEQYLHMCMLKTGMLSSIAAQLGAIIGGGTKNDTAALEKFGHVIGVAFQIQDDIMNVQPTRAWGKTTAEDITEGKLSLPVIITLEKATAEERERLLEILCTHTTDAALKKEAVALLLKHRALIAAQDAAKQLVTEAKQEITQLKRPEKLLALADFVIKRSV
ncbi:MAG: polyprenyl synthetase family protein [archaeon]